MEHLFRKIRLAVILICIGMLVSGCSLFQGSQYQKAVAAFETGNYSEAQELFEEIKTYQDSAQYLVYMDAVQKSESGEYKNATEELASLDDFLDSRVRAAYCAARVAEEEQQYEIAAELYETTGSFADSKERLAAQADLILDRDFSAVRAAVLEGTSDRWLEDITMLAAQKYSGSIMKMYENLYALGEELLSVNKLDETWLLFEVLVDYDYHDAFVRLKDIRYRRALMMLETGKVQDALECFRALLEEGYFSAEEPYRECYYQLGIMAEEQLDYAEAWRCFCQAGIHKDSAQRATRFAYEYANAEALLAEGKYAESVQAFEALYNYDDASDRIPEVQYQWAESLFEQGDFASAQTLYVALEDYRDCVSKVPECDYMQGMHALEQGEYEKAQIFFEELGDYKDCDELLSHCVYQQALQAFVREDYQTAERLFLSLNDYKNAKTLYETCVHRQQILALQPGDHLLFGQLEQDDDLSNGTEPLEWIVLERQEDRLLVISRYVLTNALTLVDGAWNYFVPCQFMQSEVNWENSNTRNYLNTTFLSNTFSEDEQAAILFAVIKAEQHPEADFEPGNDTLDQVFMLSYSELLHYFPKAEDRIAPLTRYDQNHIRSQILPELVVWNVRNPGHISWSSDYPDQKVLVYPDGSINQMGDSDDRYGVEAIRPAMWIELDSGADLITLPVQNKMIEEYDVGARVWFGHFEQDGLHENGAEPIEWMVICREENRALLLSRKALWAMRYNPSKTSTWDQSEVRAWLNETFLSEAFTQNEVNGIAWRAVRAETAHAGATTEDRVFLASRTEIERYLPEQISRAAFATPYALAKHPAGVSESGLCSCWLRSSASSNSYADILKYDGSFGTEKISDSDKPGIRPAIWVNLDMLTAELDSYQENQEYLVQTALEGKNKIHAGDYIHFGSYEQDNDLENASESIEWLVLETNEQRALLISRYILDARAYHEAFESVTWEKSTLRSWLNQEFLMNAFTAEERRLITETLVDNSDRQGYSGWTNSGSEDTVDKIFLLSYAEAWDYFFELNRHCPLTPFAQEKRTYTDHNGNGRWWLRSPGSNQVHGAYVDSDGALRFESVSDGRFGLRPALWVDFSYPDSEKWLCLVSE